MLPPAPPRFSITTVWPQISSSFLPTRRAVMSVEPPGVNGTTMRTGFAGQVAALARRARRAGAVTAAASPRKRRRLCIKQSSLKSPPDLARAVSLDGECEDAILGNQGDEGARLKRVASPYLPRRYPS